MGRELIRLLRNKGHEVTLISRQPGPGKITWVRSQIISNHMRLYAFPYFFLQLSVSAEGLGILWASTL